MRHGRGYIALLLAAVLLLMLCELHVCSGEDCMFCASIEGFRSIACGVCVCRCVLLCLSVRFSGIFSRRFSRYASAATLVDLKVRLTD